MSAKVSGERCMLFRERVAVALISFPLFALFFGYLPRGAVAGALDVGKLRLTFAEEFDELSVSPWGPNTRWIAHTPWAGDFGDARFVDPRLGVFPFVIDKGILRIEARKNPDGKWESGLLASADANGRGFSQQYGYFEARIKMPPGTGVWPAFWLHTINDPAASNDPTASTKVEIDVVEYYGNNARRFQSGTHTWFMNDREKASSPAHFTDVPAGSLSDSFNLFGILVGKDETVLYFNREEVWRTPTPADLNRPMLVLVNLALGSGWPIDQTPNPSYMYVDYIRVYSEP